MKRYYLKTCYGSPNYHLNFSSTIILFHIIAEINQGIAEEQNTQVLTAPFNHETDAAPINHEVEKERNTRTLT